MKNLKDHIDYYIWLQSHGDMTPFLKEIAPSKIKYYAAEAKSLDAAELKDYSEPKRITLLICLIHQAQVKTKDHLAEMFQKRVANIHKSSRQDHQDMKERKQSELEDLVSIFNDVLLVMASENDDATSHEKVKETIASYGSVQALLDKCEAVASIKGKNYYPFIQKHYQKSRPTLFRLADLLQFTSTSQDQSLIHALAFVMENRNKRTDWLPDEVDLSFASDQWRRMIRVKQRVGGWLIHRRHLEACVFSCIATELKSGDICVPGSESYADYREQLLSWEECEPLIPEYCRELGFPDNEVDFVKGLKSWMIQVSKQIDQEFPDNEYVSINEDGEPVLRKVQKREYKKSLKELEELIKERLPERNLLDILCNVEHWVNWTRHFGPSSGSDPKLKNPRERYILTTFAYGCNLGPVQAARHMRDVTGSVLSYTNQRHITARKLDQALKDIINHYHREFDLPKLWGKGEAAAADGTKYDIYEENLLAEYHIRYGGYGGKEALHKGEDWWGFINSGYFVGTILGGVLVWVFSRIVEKRVVLNLFFGCALLSVSTFLFSINSNPWLALILSFAMGLPNQLRSIAERTFIQYQTPEKMLPKVFAAITTIMFVTFGFSVLVMGFIADTIGVRTVYIITSVLFFLTAISSLFIQKKQLTLSDDISVGGKTMVK